MSYLFFIPISLCWSKILFFVCPKMNVFFRSCRERPTFLYRQESRQRNSSPAPAKRSLLIGLLSETLWFAFLGSSQRLGVLPRPIRVSPAFSQTLLTAAQGDYPLSRHSTGYQEFISTIVVSRKPLCAGVWVFMFFEEIKIERAMDGEPGFAEQGCESKPDRAKNRKTHWVHPQRGCRFFWILFFWQAKKSISLQRSEKGVNRKERIDPIGQRMTKTLRGTKKNKKSRSENTITQSLIS